MRRPLLLGVLLAIALVAVLYGKYELEKMIATGKLDQLPPREGPSDPAMTIDLGVEPETGPAGAENKSPQPVNSSRQDIMSALLDARQTFRVRDKASQEAGNDPHSTPASIVSAAEKLGELISLEKNNPEYKPEFQSFYLECAQDEQVLTITRVQCLEKYVDSKKLEGEVENQLVTTMDPLVQKLYRELRR